MTNQHAYLLALLSSSLILPGCGSGDNPEQDNTNNPVQTTAIYELKVTNLTNLQPLAPIAAILHNTGYHAYQPGMAASEALEKMAEGGDVSALIAAADADNRVVASTASSGLTTPGSSSILTLQGNADMATLSLTSMLVNTNDGFIGINGMDISKLPVGASRSIYAKVYDAGTEMNTEAAADLPGQGGEGYNATRNDSDLVHIHAGVVTMDDGLTSSGLDQSHRFDNPAAKIMITRRQ